MSVLALFGKVARQQEPLTPSVPKSQREHAAQLLGHLLHAGRAHDLEGGLRLGELDLDLLVVEHALAQPLAHHLARGVVGDHEGDRQFLQPFAVVITAATLSSLLVSFTLTPMLASRWYRQGQSNGLEMSPLGHKRT